MEKSKLLKLSLAVVLLAGAGYGFLRFFRSDSGVSDQEYFYDLSERKLFAAPREALPPIRGLDNPEEDAVRAVVIRSPGSPDNPGSRSIAYLEKFAPELKANLEQVRLGKAEALPSKTRNAYRFVKRVEDDAWQRADSAQGQAILNGWSVAGPDGKFPVVCSP